MRLLVKHVALPSLAPAAIVGLYFTPVSLIGCVNRGLIALAIVFLSLITGIALGIFALRARRKGDAGSAWRVISILILTLPALLVLGPLG